jgi:hypothetical protein
VQVPGKLTLFINLLNIHFWNPAEVEFVCLPNDPNTAAWYARRYGSGVLISDPTVSGRTFIPKEQLDEYED